MFLNTKELEVYKQLSSTHNMGYICVNNWAFAWLNILLTPCIVPTIRRSVYPKGTGTSQCLHSTCFVLQSNKLVKTSCDRARKNCTADTLDMELNPLEKFFVSNALAKPYLLTHREPRITKKRIVTVRKCPVYISLPYWGEDDCKLFQNLLNVVVNRAYYVARPVVHFTTNKIP